MTTSQKIKTIAQLVAQKTTPDADIIQGIKDVLAEPEEVDVLAFPGPGVPGMTLRQYYTGQALSSVSTLSSLSPLEAVEYATKIADALIKGSNHDPLKA